MLRIKSQPMLISLLMLSLIQSCNPTLAIATDLAQIYRPSFPIGSPSPYPSIVPSPTPSDPDDEVETEVALTHVQEVKVVECFRDEKACETSLQTCSASVDTQNASIMDRIFIFIGGIIAGFVIHNNLK